MKRAKLTAQQQKKRDALLDVLTVLFACPLISAAIAVFNVPNDIAPGGVAGLSTALAAVFPPISVGVWMVMLNTPLLLNRAFKTHLTVGALHLIHGVGPQLPRVDRVGAEVGGDGVAQHVQFHRALEKNTAEPIVVVVQRTLNGGEDGLGEVGGVVLRAEIAHVEPQGLFYEFIAAAPASESYNAGRDDMDNRGTACPRHAEGL